MTQYGMIVLWSCTDQGDTSSSDWLDLKALIGTQGYHLIPIKFAFTLLTTTTHPHPWLATLPLVHPSCAGNLSTENRLLILMLVISLGPLPIQPILILWPIWCNLSHGMVVDTSDSNQFRFPNNVGAELSFLGRRTMTLFNVFNVGRTTTFLSVTGMIAFGHICVMPRKNFKWSGGTLSMILSSTTF